MEGTRLGGIVLAGGILVLLSACAEPEPTSLQPSVWPSPSETPRESPVMTTAPATPPLATPGGDGSANVVVAVDDARIAYAVQGCPVTAWLDDTIEDDVNFGIFPEYLTADDGTRWSTHLVVLQISNGSVTNWSFRLTSPLSGIPGDVERILTSEPDEALSIELAITDGQATFTTRFFDSVYTGNSPALLPGTVSVTCR